MKELSIEEKAQKYDEAIKVARSKIKNDKDHVLYEEDITDIFPELKENEDEKIRKKLIAYFKNLSDVYSLEPLEINPKKVIVWLEKQKVLTTEEDLQGKEDVLWCIKQAKKYAKDENEMGTCWFAEKWLEKQGQTFTKKDVDDAYLEGVTNTKNEIEKEYEATYQIRKDIATFILNYKGDIKDRAKWMNYLGIKVSFVERQCEQKHINQNPVEWSEDERIKQFLIHEVTETSDKIMSYRNMNKKDVLAWLEKQGEQKPTTEIKSAEESLGIDSETYNKIVDECIYGENKPTDKVEPKFKVGQTIKKEGFNLGFNIVKIEDGFYYNDMGDHFPFTDQDNWELVEQKSAETEKGAKGNDREIPFSEQEPVLIIPKFRVGDEIKTSNEESLTITKIDKKGYWSEDLFICGFGGECLWDLVEQKPWSEEDENHVKSILSTIECCKAQFPNSQAVVEAYNADIEWLKSLRPQNTWKPSEEQMKALRKAEATIGVNHVVLAGLISDLEKLTE